MSSQLGFSRASLIEKLMKENPMDDSSEPVLVEEERFLPRNKMWTDLSTFVKDNLLEVKQKLSQIEPQIWGKLILMEKNYRIAKAYLRHPTVTIDGSVDEFDGIKLGFGYFQNENRDLKTEMDLKSFKGIRIQMDSAGNLWMKKMPEFEQQISVKTKLKRESMFLSENYKKVFDLRNFKENIISKLGTENGDKKQFCKSAILFLKLSDTKNENEFLTAQFWCCLIHIIAIDMIDALAAEFDVIVPNSLTNSTGSQQSNQTNFSTVEDSSISSSGYQPISSRNSKTGVAKRIFQRKPANSTPMLEKHKKRSQSQTRTYAAPIVLPRPLSPPRLLSNSVLNGWSLLNLSDIDKLKNPAYFASREEAGSRRPLFSFKSDEKQKSSKMNRSKSKNYKESFEHLQKYKWLSETCLANV